MSYLLKYLDRLGEGKVKSYQELQTWNDNHIRKNRGTTSETLRDYEPKFMILGFLVWSDIAIVVLVFCEILVI